MATDVNCWLPPSSAGTWLFRSITDSVIPESARGGYPWFDRLTTLSGVEGESRTSERPLDTGSHPPQADSSGMTIVGLFASFE